MFLWYSQALSPLAGHDMKLNCGDLVRQGKQDEKVKPGLSFKSSIFFSELVKRLSTQITSFPSLSKRLDKCEPMNPAPPAIRIFIVLL